MGPDHLQKGQEPMPCAERRLNSSENGPAGKATITRGQEATFSPRLCRKAGSLAPLLKTLNTGEETIYSDTSAGLESDPQISLLKLMGEVAEGGAGTRSTVEGLNLVYRLRVHRHPHNTQDVKTGV